jgi:spore coat protein U-like protein
MPISTRTTALTAALIGAIGLSSAHAATDITDTFKVSITLENSCLIDAKPLDFGIQTSLANDIDAATTVEVKCTGANPVSIAFNAGTGTGSTISDRQMNNSAGDTVDYNLYSDASRTNATLLGDGVTGTTIAFTSTGSDVVDVKDVYGRVPTQTAKPSGAYESIVTATLTF